jgi:L-threonylcarbamoyladenylate synthase
VKSTELSVDISDPEEEIVEKAASLLLSGGVLIYPSDTVYGILCRADRRDSVKRIAKIKGYMRQRPFILLVDGAAMVETVADCGDPEVIGIMECRWPGKLTIVLPASEECPKWVRGEDNTVALRHPADPLSGQLLKRCGVPLVSTSANLSGEDTVCSVSAIPLSIIAGVDIVLNAGDLPPSSPSTILRLLRSRGRT